ncbi:MAG: NADPH:quinone oxidoreductase family protein [Solirubrobacteraceae bacterium]|nr:NADPH:quinone oxidoreductase family protein [Solirubrobacteraceae bacterium]
MRAVQQLAFGGPEVLEPAELPDPQPGPGELLVEVELAGVNFADTHQRRNEYLAEAELPFVPGSEVAGIVAGSGRRVVAMTGGRGGYAELAVVPEAMAFELPDGLGPHEALALLVQGLTAWHLLRSCARLAPGESVAVHAAAGGTGSLAVQLAREFGAGTVVATASTPEKRELALACGADVAIDGAPEGLADRLVEAAGGRLDVVLDAIGGEVFDESMEALAPFGRMVTYGVSGGRTNTVNTRSLMKNGQAVVGFWLAHCYERPELLAPPLAECFELAAEGRLRPLLGDRYPLSRAAAAQEDLAGRRTTGKLVLDPSA